jgi:allantoinase
MDNSGTTWAIRSRNVVTPAKSQPATVVIDGEAIAAVLPHHYSPPGVPVTDVGDHWLIPGLVDTHVHINEPGRTEWEGFETATRAAIAGGITTLIDMPLNSSPVTTTVEALRLKQAAAEGKITVDCGFHGGVIPHNVKHIRPLIDAGVCAFKAFLCPSGIDEFPHVSEADLRQAMPILAEARIPLFVHAELMSPLPPGVEANFAANPRSYRAWLAMRPVEWEVDAIRLMIKLCREFRGPVHIVHLSSGAALADIRQVREEGLPLTVETCPHYLNFAAEEIADGDTRFKCAPPIRSRHERDRLRAAVELGEIHTIGSDHSPAPPELKHLADGSLRDAWGGIASLSLLLSASNSVLSNGEALVLRPSRLVGLSHRKGSIVANCNADLAVVDPDIEWTVTPDDLHFRHRISPYVGRKMIGKVLTTFLRGRKVFDRGEFLGGPNGQLLERPPPEHLSLSFMEAGSARDALFKCCGSSSWATAMVSRRPFANRWALMAVADEIWFGLATTDWFEAFAAHPRIGDLQSLREKFTSTADLCRGEQAGAMRADESTLRDLAAGNAAYEAKFGHIFIVCATGKSAAEMLAILRSRLNNDPETELLIAATEQAKITRLRLEKLCTS